MSFPLSALPDELALSCLARVSRSGYTALSCVSKRYHSLLRSPEFYKTRSLSGFTKKCFYVCLRTRGNSTPLWFMLSEKNENRIMSQIPSYPSQAPVGSSMVVLDWGIYVIGGLIKENPTSEVLLFDCRTHSWRRLPSMGVARSNAAVVVDDDGKIYVFGGLEGNDSSNWAEVFDPKTITWNNFIPMEDDLKQEEKDKVYEMVCGSRGVCFYNDVLLGKTDSEDYTKLGIISYCSVTENVLYSCDRYGKLFWRKLKELEWKEVKGLETLRSIFAKSDSMTLFDMLKHDSELRKYGENIVLVWFKYRDDWLEFNDDHKGVELWCAEVSFQRCEEKGEVWGTIEWMEAVATLDRNLFDFKVDVLCSASVNV